ncbi:MAG: glutaredoxin family protein [Chloroflexi bacterium]|nr:glutaredoxin family protein [Chloroflexota bacterium]
MTLSATLFTRPGCHLCEDATAHLERLRRRYPHQLRQVDITADANLLRQYGERIPVLAIAGREYDAPLPAAVLERALRAADPER